MSFPESLDRLNDPSTPVVQQQPQGGAVGANKSILKKQSSKGTILYHLHLLSVYTIAAVSYNEWLRTQCSVSKYDIIVVILF